MRILILGGYGTFGGRLVRMLADESQLTLIVTGRSKHKAQAFVDRIEAKAELQAEEVDRNGDIAAAIAALNPDIVVDASGPFQTYGEAPYRVVEATLEAGIGYLDLADGAEFVTRIARYDAEAKRRGVFALSGVSTFPALSSAVVRHLANGWQRVLRIECGLAPSPRAGLGSNVIRAILAYAGSSVPLTRSGKLSHGAALIDSRRRTIRPPGIAPMPNLRYALVEVPDLRLMAEDYPGLRNIWVGVGTRPQFLLRILSIFARLVKWGLMLSLSSLSGMAERTMRWFPWGEHRSGMFVEVAGINKAGQATTRSWHLIAEGDDGPFIPAMAAEALIRQTLAGTPPQSGARPATNDIDLTDYEAAFAKKNITTGIRDARDGPLYERILGSAWDQLPEPIRVIHAAPDGLRVVGRAIVERGRNPLARFVAAIVGFPKADTDVPVEVRFTEREGGELWERNFAGKKFSSFQKEGTGSTEGLLVERFGPLSFGLALVVEGDRLKLVTRSWRAFGIPMPRFLAPGGEAFEFASNGVFNFHVEISHPLTGLIVRYRGNLRQ